MGGNNSWEGVNERKTSGVCSSLGACSEDSYAKNIIRKTMPSKIHPMNSQTLRRTMPKMLQAVKSVTVPTTPKNGPGKNRNGPQCHIFRLGGWSAMIPPMFGNKALSRSRPSNEAPVTRNQRNFRLLRSINSRSSKLRLDQRAYIGTTL